MVLMTLPLCMCVEQVMHLGTDFDKDVVGAAKAGFQSIWVVCPSYDILDPQQEAQQVRLISFSNK